MKSTIRKIEYALSILFLLLLLTPLIGTAISGPLFENPDKTSTDMSKNLSIISLLKGFGSFKYNFSENYYFRENLIETVGLMKSKILKIASTDKVLIGKSGWLFLASERVIDNHRNIYSFTESEKELWLSTLLKRKIYSNEMGANYFFVISPDKHNIYSDFLPTIYQPINQKSRMDELLEFTKKSDIRVIDLRYELLSNKKNQNLYYKTDTHWNEYGAYIAHIEIMNFLKSYFPEIRLSSKSVPLESAKTHGGDLARLAGLNNYMIENLTYPIISRNASLQNGEPIDLQMIDVQHTGTIETICSTGELESAVIFHDSFGVALIPYIAEHFQKAFFIRSNDYDPEIIKSIKPQVVIQQIVERRLLNWTPKEDEISKLF